MNPVNHLTRCLECFVSHVHLERNPFKTFHTKPWKVIGPALFKTDQWHFFTTCGASLSDIFCLQIHHLPPNKIQMFNLSLQFSSPLINVQQTTSHYLTPKMCPDYPGWSAHWCQMWRIAVRASQRSRSCKNEVNRWRRSQEQRAFTLDQHSHGNLLLTSSNFFPWNAATTTKISRHNNITNYLGLTNEV